MFLKISPDTYRDLQAVIENLGLNKSINQLAEEIIRSFLDSTVEIYNSAVESKPNVCNEKGTYIIDELPTDSRSTNYYLAYAIKTYLEKTSFNPSQLNISDEEINHLLSEFRENYPPAIN